jgi:hypothetical protein
VIKYQEVSEENTTLAQSLSLSHTLSRQLCVAMAQSITDRITLHTQQLANLDIREFYRKQQELLCRIADSGAYSPRSGTTSSTRPSSAHSTAGPLLRPLSAASTTPSLAPIDDNSPPDSPLSRASTHLPSLTNAAVLSRTSFASSAHSALSRSSFLSEFSEYSAILPKHLLGTVQQLSSSSSSSPNKKSARPGHKHRLQTTFTINEAGEREYSMTALAQDPVAELDDRNDFLKPTCDEHEKIIYR